MTTLKVRKLTKNHPRKPMRHRARNEGLQLLSPLAKKFFQYIQAGSGEGGRNMANRKSMAFPIQMMKQSAMLVLNVAWETSMLL